MNPINTNIVLTLFFIIALISIVLFLSTSEYYNPPPVVSSSQTYEWVTEGNPNIGFAPATRFIPPSRKECLKWVQANNMNPDEAFTKFIECVQNVSSKVWIKNLPIQSPGVSSEEYRY
jgi:hypothetical protein